MCKVIKTRNEPCRRKKGTRYFTTWQTKQLNITFEDIGHCSKTGIDYNIGDTKKCYITKSGEISVISTENYLFSSYIMFGISGLLLICGILCCMY